MTFLIAAAGTGGHVYPGLAVGEALVELGVSRDDVLFVGGTRLEADVYPQAGFPFLQVELRGLQRSLSLKNLTLPMVVRRARDSIVGGMKERSVRVSLGMGGYVTVPTSLAAIRLGVTLMIAEQNAGAGLANRIAKRWAKRCFSSFPRTEGLRDAEWVGNPVRASIRDFDRAALRPIALTRYSLSASEPVLGVFGGSLGAGVINSAVANLVAGWDGPPLQILHLTGDRDAGGLDELPVGPGAIWRRIAYETEMELFYAASDFVLARAGGAVAELTATATPAILVPGGFGSSGHQVANAEFLKKSGAALVLPEEVIAGLETVVKTMLADDSRLSEMAASARSIARPGASRLIARAMMDAAS